MSIPEVRTQKVVEERVSNIVAPAPEVRTQKIVEERV